MTVSKIRLAAMNFLAQREHSVAELTNKLFKKFSPNDNFCMEELELVISSLIADNLLNDERFTQMFVSSRVAKGFGPIKIAYELTQKKVAQDIIEAQLYRDPEIWLEQMEKLRTKKFGKLIPQNVKEKSRQFRYFYQRGYSAEQINLMLN